jgi:hypothetical protein
MTEQDIMRSIMLAPHGCRLWRNNTGAIKDETGRLVRFGLCTGSSDLIGIRPITITADMVGTRVGVFTAIEVKTPKGKPTVEQINFIQHVKGLGGIAGVARSVGDALTITSCKH